MAIQSIFSGSAFGALPRSEHVQIRLRPELKQEIEALKYPRKLSWQTLVEQLLEAWVQMHRQTPQLRPDATTRPPSPTAPDQRQLAELYARLLAVVDQLAPLVASQGLSPAAAAGRVALLPHDVTAAHVPSGNVLPTARCQKCQHTWTPRKSGTPGCCPHCKNPQWWKPRQRARRRAA
jgi:hypothetical protein